MYLHILIVIKKVSVPIWEVPDFCSSRIWDKVSPGSDWSTKKKKKKKKKQNMGKEIVTQNNLHCLLKSKNVVKKLLSNPSTY